MKIKSISKRDLKILKIAVKNLTPLITIESTGLTDSIEWGTYHDMIDNLTKVLKKNS